MIYVAFLKGINVGKHIRIKMQDLKHLFETRGLKNVQTYLQSGNVIFESDKDEFFLSKMIEQEIFIIHKYVVPVVIRTVDELKQVISNCPFSKEQIKEAALNTGERPYVSFLKYNLTSEKLEILNQKKEEGNIFVAKGREIYLLFLHSTIRKSKLVRNLHHIDVHATVRNWSTIMKLNKLIKEM